ncbi:hypothetical protein ACP70R_006015 [Stipagrostis hirtigluma subsp. patula]
MLAASSIVNSNLACSSRISSCSDFTSGHSWRPIDPAKLHRKRAAISLRISCAATKPAKTPAEEDWKTKRQVLVEKKVRSVDVKEALRLQKENNFVILDVRPEAEFKEAHPPGAINVQIYRLIKEWTAWDIARRAAFAFFGIFAGTEENPEFVQSVDAKVGKDAKIIVACSTGGTLKPTQNFPDGKQSRALSSCAMASLRGKREKIATQLFQVINQEAVEFTLKQMMSLIAAYLLVLNGYKNVYYLDGGLYTWFKEGLPAVRGEE